MYNPISFTYTSLIKPLTREENIDYLILPVVNKDSLLSIDRKIYEETPNVPFRFGYPFHVNISLLSFGTWDTLENGGRLWRYKIICPGAFSINLIYNKFYLPEGALFFIYDSSKRIVLGEFTSENNKPHGKFATDLIPGEICTLELYEPERTKGRSIIEISEVFYGYVDITYNNLERSNNEKLGDLLMQSGLCERNANCPVGANWCREKYSISQIIVNGTHLCTGSLINNVRQDFTPYLLTADHCILPNSNPDVWIFRFGYIYSNCDGGETMTSISYTGADLLSRWSTSDFALLELQEQPISGQAEGFPDVFFNGWDRSGDTPDSTICLHHPRGDRMKISIDFDPPQSFEGNNFWNCDWDLGTTEGGSSGSPLFDTKHRVIGQVSHGHYPPGTNDPCHPNKTTCFGKFSVSWNGGGTSQTRLRDWLDPDNTGVETLDGIHLPTNIFGRIVNAGTWNINAYDQMLLGSGIHNNTTVPMRIGTNATVTLKAGREIVFLPCTQIIYGSEFHAQIQTIACNENIIHSDRDNIYTSSCGAYGKFAADEIPYTDDNKPEFISNKVLILPNPASSDINVTYTLSSPVPVTMFITNALGIKAIDFLTCQEIITGKIELHVNISDLPSGVYFLTIVAGGETITKPFVVIK